MRLKHKPWAQDALDDNPDIVIKNPESVKGEIQDRFNKAQPLHVEIGTGKGQFITGLAEQQADANFVGIELQTSVIVDVLTKILDNDIKNVQLINMNANDLEGVFEENSIDHIYLNFSDPWPKNRHEKRRLTYKTYLTMYEKLLKKDGKLTFKTDNRFLFEYSLMSFSAYGANLDDVSLNLHSDSDNYPYNIQTEYEERFSKNGNPIYLAQISFN